MNVTLTPMKWEIQINVTIKFHRINIAPNWSWLTMIMWTLINIKVTWEKSFIIPVWHIKTHLKFIRHFRNRWHKSISKLMIGLISHHLATCNASLSRQALIKTASFHQFALILMIYLLISWQRPPSICSPINYGRLLTYKNRRIRVISGR
jgi:hypothetical protein